MKFTFSFSQKNDIESREQQSNEAPLALLPISILRNLPINITGNKFINEFEKVMRRAEFIPPFAPLVIDSHNGKLLCRKIHKQQLVKLYGTGAFIEMANRGLQLQEQKQQSNHHYNNGSSFSLIGRGNIPLMAMLESDPNGCSVVSPRLVDNVAFPRLTWSIPLPKYNNNSKDNGSSWCGAIGVPGYTPWRDLVKPQQKTKLPKLLLRRSSFWDRTFNKHKKQYPWSSKISKAVWRGTTTYDPQQYKGSKLHDTPRGRLVKTSMRHPELIDAGFASIIQQYEEQKDELAKETIVVNEYMPFDDQMKYKAIIDIDGNSWSARFTKLLCLNSVVIKIDQDWGEYFYHDLKPMVHYIPASLENITDATAYVINIENEEEMKSIVDSANKWCKEQVTEEELALDTIKQIEMYDDSLNAYMKAWMSTDEWIGVKNQLVHNISDLVDCYCVGKHRVFGKRDDCD
eukprot:CAMPEP_0172303372 /NCGR_PEP_ID=MMETSP1058-20130122/4910_1 /TAXON_ID=83371 /ORGANISM="Detonula confervacea, Strain CCMP 353" /LENGTH=457 /DNA_ID=CAMNT_0013014155 /DNA_START=63 /DNA_END=1436 /DNA_ORIENTATION=+